MPNNRSSQSGSSTAVFIGGTVGFSDLGSSANTAALKSAGHVGLYMQESAIEAAYSAGTLAAIASGMAGTGAGEAELNLQLASQVGGWFSSYWVTYFTNFGLFPTEVNSVIDFSSTTWIADFDATVVAARAHGITSIAPIFSPNAGNLSLTSFSTDPTYADIRAAAILGGGLTLDAPPAYFVQRGVDYQSFIYQEIQWAHQNSLRVTVIISPYNDDATFTSDTEDYVKMLDANNAIPSEWVVENYGGSALNVGSASDPNSLAGNALWVAQNGETNVSGASTPVITPTITVSSPGTIREAYFEAGVTVTETVTTTGFYFPIYVGVLTAENNVEGSFVPVTLNSNGTATFTVNYALNGDYLVAESGSVLTRGTPVVITDAPTSISVSAPGTLVEPTFGAGVSVTEVITTSNIMGPVYAAVFTSAGVMESAAFVPVTLNASGQGTASLNFAHSGDYVTVENRLVSPDRYVNSTPITINDVITPYITVSAPGMVAEASAGAGVSVTETVNTVNINGPVYAAVFTAQGLMESAAYVPVTLNASSQGTVSLNFLHSGDYVTVENRLVSPDRWVYSSPITITDPTPTITLSSLGTVQEPSIGAGATVTEAVTTTGLTGSVYAVVLTQNGTPEDYWQTVPLGANGTASFQVHLQNSGDYVVAVNNLANATVAAVASPVTITEPPPVKTILLSAPGTVQEITVGAGVTVTEAISTSNLSGTVYTGILTASGGVESSWQADTLNSSGSLNLQVHFAHSGDYLVAVDSLTSPTVATFGSPIVITDPTTNNPSAVSANKLVKSSIYTSSSTSIKQESLMSIVSDLQANKSQMASAVVGAGSSTGTSYGSATSTIPHPASVSTMLSPQQIASFVSQHHSLFA